MSLKAVIFDLGLTLIRTESFPEIYRRILARFGIPMQVEDIVQAQKETETEFDMSTYYENQRKEFWTNYNVLLLEKLDIKENTTFLAAQIDALWWDCSNVKAYPDVEPTLSGLRAKGLQIGLISNGFKQDLDNVLNELELEKWFDVITCIDSCNCAKPDKQIFLYTLDKLGVKADEAVFVGDSVEQDYEGAFGVGIRPFLIDREEKHPNHFNKISSLTELLTVL